VVPGGAARRDPADIATLVADVEQPVILCGHDHVPGTAALPDGRLVVDPGSVGLQAFTDVTPHPHSMEAGTPHARYAAVTRGAMAWMAESVHVEYDWDAAAADAVRNGRPDWADWLRTGRAAP
jgi:diadenosine tetraphosphatase ApaH/serine/threonine PP2A family protein phosphatase